MQFTSAQNKRSILSLHYCVLQGGTNEFPQCCATTGAGHTLNPWLGVKTNKKNNYSSMHNFICFDKPICEGLHFQCGKNCFDHKYRFTLPKINLINSTLRCQDRKSEAINRHLSFTSKCNIFSKGISELPQH